MSLCHPNGSLTFSGLRTSRSQPTGACASSVAALPTDSIGTTTVTFSGINSGSEIRVYLPDTTELSGIESCAVDQVLSWSVYTAGNANNTVRIVIIHPGYKIKEFTYLSQTGNQSIPVQQEPDKWYRND